MEIVILLGFWRSIQPSSIEGLWWGGGGGGDPWPPHKANSTKLLRQIKQLQQIKQYQQINPFQQSKQFQPFKQLQKIR